MLVTVGTWPVPDERAGEGDCPECQAVALPLAVWGLEKVACSRYHVLCVQREVHLTGQANSEDIDKGFAYDMVEETFFHHSSFFFLSIPGDIRLVIQGRIVYVCVCVCGGGWSEDISQGQSDLNEYRVNGFLSPWIQKNFCRGV
jgi:hypothetical protein